MKILKHNKDGTLDLSSVQDAAGSCGVYVEQPNPLGILDGGLTQIKEIIGDNTALIVGVQPVSLGLVEAPGNYGAKTLLLEKDNHSAVRRQVVAPFTESLRVANLYLRLIPSRIVGRSIDVDGKEAYCLTLSTRDNTLRRHRATSNICANETLIALMGAMHMSLLGPEGLEHLATRNMTACILAKQKLSEISGISLPHFASSHFNEFVVEFSKVRQIACDTSTASGLLADSTCLCGIQITITGYLSL